MKKIFTLLFTALLSMHTWAQEAKTAFINMPDSLMPLLTAVNRADFIDFLESNMKAEVTNKFNTNSEMTALTPSYIHIRMTDKSTWQMKLLPVAGNAQIICVINTTCAPACDSYIHFYTTNWEELPTADYITLPKEDDFFIMPTQEQQHEYTQLRMKADIFLKKAELDKDNEILSFLYTTPDYMDTEEAKKLKPYIRSALEFEWNQGKFTQL